MKIKRTQCGKHVNSPPVSEIVLHASTGNFEGFLRGYMGVEKPPSFVAIHILSPTKAMIEFTFGTYIYEEQ